MLRFSASRLLVVILCLGLAGCGGRISAENRAALRKVQLVTPPSGATAAIYSDRTSTGAAMAGSAFGLVGGLIAAGVVAKNSEAGLKRWSPVLAGKDAEVLARIRSEVEKRFSASAGIRFAEAGPQDGKLVFKNLSYGIIQSGGQDFVVSITSSVEMQKASGEAVWQCFGNGISTTKRTLEQYQQEPAAFPTALNEAVAAFAQNLVERY